MFKESIRGKFSLGDMAQQMVGGFLLAGPFVVTEEVWKLASNMDYLNSLVTILIVLSIGYGALYKADKEREIEEESEVAGIPLRFISLISISYLSVIVLIFTLAAPQTFGATLETSMKVVSVASIFSVIGAATADTLL